MKRAIKVSCFLLVPLLASALLFVFCAPQLGSVGQEGKVLRSVHLKDGKFFNTIETRVSTSSRNRLSSLLEFFTDQKKREPEIVLPSMPVKVESVGTGEGLKVT